MGWTRGLESRARQDSDWLEANVKIGARNRIIGTVAQIQKGKLMCLVKVNVPASSRMASVMTLESLKDLGIKKGDKVEVVVKAVNVLLLKG